MSEAPRAAETEAPRVVERPWGRAGAGALVALALLLGANTVYRAGFGSKLRTDLPVYLTGARRVLAGEDPLHARSPERGWPYVYPPTFAVLVSPLAALPLPVAAGLWFVLSAAALAVGVVCVRSAAERSGPLRGWGDLLPLALILLPCASALTRGQVGPLLLGLLGGALWALRRGRAFLCGALLSLAAAIKVTPAFLLVGLLAARRWRAAAATLAGLVVWLLLVPAPFLGFDGAGRALAHYGQRMLLPYADDPAGYTPDPDAPPLRYPVHVGTNQSLASQLARRTQGPVGALLLLALAAAVAGPALLLAARGLAARAPPRLAVAGFGALLAAPLLAAPVAWHHHHVLLFPALVVAALERRARPLCWALGAFALFSLLHFAVRPLRPYGLLGLGTLGVHAALLAWGLGQARGLAPALGGGAAGEVGGGSPP
ncbi:MAG: DUF2029 domain-containing protein [Planctomycetota bacterium]|nr:MAG: DUF2029 domain-containing protein [Planctomycetota bacterium]